MPPGGNLGTQDINKAQHSPCWSSFSTQNPTWGAKAYRKGLTASWDLGMGTMMASTQMSWKMAPRKSPYRSRFSRKVGSGTSGGEKSRSEAMASAACCRGLLWLTSLESTSKYKGLSVMFLQLTFKWSHLHARAHRRTHKAIVVKC